MKWSELLRLPYLDIVRSTVVDPMHTVLLGTVKHLMKTMQLSNTSLAAMQARMADIHPPSNVGRIPGKIEAGFASLTANEWRNWITIYAPICTKGLVADKEYDLISKLSKAVCLMCTKVITVDAASKVEGLLREYNDDFEIHFGKDSCVPNLHMQLHLKELILDYGPVYSFRCFGFERLNGILGKFKTNTHDISIHLMRKVTFNAALRQLTSDDHASPNAHVPLDTVSEKIATANGNRTGICNLIENAGHVLCKESTDALTQDEINDVVAALQCACNHDEVITDVLELTETFARVEQCGTTFSSRDNRPTHILAKWVDNSSNGMPIVNAESAARPGRIEKLMRCTVRHQRGSKASRSSVIVAEVHWFKTHTIIPRDYFGYPSLEDTEPESVARFIPLSKVISDCLACNISVPGYHCRALVVTSLNHLSLAGDDI